MLLGQRIARLQMVTYKNMEPRVVEPETPYYFKDGPTLVWFFKKGHPRPHFRLLSVFFKQTPIQFYNKFM